MEIPSGVSSSTSTTTTTTESLTSSSSNQEQYDITSLEILNKCHLELYPKKETIIIDDNNDTNNYTHDDLNNLINSLNIPLLSGEYSQFIGKCGKLNEDLIIITNYRLLNILNNNTSFINLPLMQIDFIEIKDILFIYVYLKNSKTLRITFSSNEKCLQWYQRLLQITTTRITKLDEIFAFAFYLWHSQETQTPTLLLFKKNNPKDFIKREYKRLQFDICKEWRLTEANLGYKLCSTYPEYLIVPSTINDDQLIKVSNFRSSKRFPTVVWRSKQNGCILARSSQPNVGLLAWRLNEDEQLVKELAMNGILLIVDARCRSVALANRVKGGGYEYSEYYTNCEIQFMNLENIHVIRSSFQSLRLLCQTQVDNKQFLSQLEHTKWLHYLSAILKASRTVVSTIDRQSRSVLIHCSDGWDRTPQILALSKLLLDPYYRTIEGFRVLIEIDWLMFGHKFSQRNGHAVNFYDPNERCPVFLQWLDCVYQLTQQFPTAFEFNEYFLLKLCVHSYSCLFGTFLCDSHEERDREKLFDRTFSVWSFLNSSNKQFINYLYDDDSNDSILYPAYELVNLRLWYKLYTDTDIVYLTQESVLNLTTSSDNDLVDNINNIISNKNLSSSFKKSCSLNDLTKLNGSMISSTTNGSHINMDTHHNLNDEPVQIHTVRSSSESNLILADALQNLNVSNGHTDDAILSSSVTVKSPTHKTSTDTLVEHKTTDNDNDSDSNNSSTSSSRGSNTQAKSISTSTSGLSDFVYTNKLDHISSTIKKFELTFDQNKQTINKCIKNDINLTSHNSSSISLNGSYYFSCSNVTKQQQQQISHVCCNNSPLNHSLNEHKNNRTLRQCIDIDGLTLHDNNCFKKIIERDDFYKKEISMLKSQIQKCKSFLSSLSTNTNLWHFDGSFNDLQLNDVNNVKNDLNLNNSNNRYHSESFSSDSICSSSWDELEKPEVTTWVPDHCVTHCQNCNKEFSLSTRKHHCRNCGYVFCHKCSNYFYPLPHQNLNTPVRICVQCKLKIDNNNKILNKENTMAKSNGNNNNNKPNGKLLNTTSTNSIPIPTTTTASNINTSNTLTTSSTNNSSGGGSSMCNLNGNRSLSNSLSNSQQKVSV